MDQVKAIEAAEREPGSESEDEEGGDGGGSAAHDAVAGRLRDDALEGMGHLHRRLAHRLALPPLPRVADYGGAAACGGRLLRGHRLSVTAVALTADERTVFSVSKDGAILEHDVESGARQRFVASSAAGLGRVEQTGTEADWVKRGPRQSGAASLLAAAVSGDGRYLAVGGGDRKVHVWDARSRQYVRVSCGGCAAAPRQAALALPGRACLLAVGPPAGRCLSPPSARSPAAQAAAPLCGPAPSPSRRTHTHTQAHALLPSTRRPSPAGLPRAQGRGDVPGVPGGHARAVQRLSGQIHQAVEPGRHGICGHAVWAPGG